MAPYLEIVTGRRVSVEDAKRTAEKRLGLKGKIGALLLWSRLKGEDMPNVIAEVIRNIWAPGSRIPTGLGVAILTLAGFVTWYCATDATGGWIDPHCAYYVQAAMYLSGIAHLLAPGFTSSVNDPRRK